MTFFATGFLTVGLVYLFNKVILAPLNNFRIIAIIPLVEESAKTLFPLFLGSSVLLNHAFFGAFEALYDFWLSGRRNSLLALGGFLGHFFFGYMTLVGFKLFDYSIAGIIFGYLPHLVWNFATVKMGEY